MNGDSVDPVLILLIGSGLSDKKVRDIMMILRDADIDDSMRRFRSLKKAISKTPKPQPVYRRTTEEEVERALKSLRSLGPHSESEIIDLLASAPEAGLFRQISLSKSGLKSWLLAFVNERGIDSMTKVVNSVRNDLIHNPRSAWTIKDVK